MATDGYKFSMAEAGWPLRTETFHYSHRKGRSSSAARRRRRVRALAAAQTDRRRLPLSRRALLRDGARLQSRHRSDETLSRSAPCPRRRLLRSASRSSRSPVRPPLVSWLEPLVLMLHYRIQVASRRRRGPRRDLRAPARDRPRDARCRRPLPRPRSRVDSDGYYRRVLAAAKALVEAVKDPDRIFEVGMRSASCLEQHEIALRACLEAGVQTHQQRPARPHAGNDSRGHHGPRARSALRRGRARVPRDARAPPRPLELPARHLRHDPQRHPRRVQLIRGSQPRRLHPLRLGRQGEAVPLRRRACEEPGHPPRHDPRGRLGLSRSRSASRPCARKSAGSPTEQFYGYGGHLVAATAPGALTRDRVAAVWKLSQTGGTSTMKFADDANRGKESVPGRPRALAPHAGQRPDRHRRPGGRGRARGLRGLGRSAGRSEVRPRVQSRNPGAPEQAPEDPIAHGARKTR